MSSSPVIGHRAKALSGWRAFVLSSCAFCLALSPLSSSVASPAKGDDIPPTREIVISDGSREPEWKLLWDQARDLTRQKKYAEAARSYSQLLDLKGNIEEATWEYALVLITLAEWEQAETIMEILLGKDPHRTDYLLNAGFVAVKMQEFPQAVTLYQAVYNQQPELDETQSIDALTGLVAALQGQGKREAAFSYMEQLHQYHPQDRNLLQQLASSAATSHRREKALLYYGKLISQPEVEDSALLEAATVFERYGQVHNAVLCWEKYLHRHPDYRLFQAKLADYLVQQGEKEAALPYLLQLLEQENQKAQQRELLLRQVGEIYLFDLQRPDKALPYYEELCQRQPENPDFIQERDKIQEALAREMAAKVAQEGAEGVWKKLAPLSPNRLAIYSSMVASLEKRGDSKELRGALTIIHQHNPDNQGVILRLAELSLAQQDVKQAERFLGLLSPESCQQGGTQSRYLLANAQLTERQGLLSAAISWYRRYLEVATSDSATRRLVMDLAGSSGLLVFYEEQFVFFRQEARSEADRLALDLQYARVLASNGLATQAKRLAQKLLTTGQGDTQFRAETQMVLATSLYGEGNIFEAEQVLRTMVVDSALQPEILNSVLFQLVEIAVQSKDADLAWAWGTVLSAQVAEPLASATCSQAATNLSLLRARALALSGKLTQGIESLHAQRKRLNNQCPADATTLSLQYQTDLLMALFYLQDRQYDKAQGLIKTLIQDHPRDQEPKILARQLVDTGTSGALQIPSDSGAPVTNATEATIMPLMRVAQLEEQYGDTGAALQLVRMARQKEPESLLARTAEARLLRAHGLVDEAGLAFQSLVADYPQETSFTRQLLDLEFQQASFQQIIVRLAPSWPTGIEKEIMSSPDTSQLEIWQKLILARSLWADRQWQAAIAVYEALLQPAVEQLFSEKIAEKKIELLLPPPKKSFINTITMTQPAEPNRLTVVMTPAFIMERRRSGKAMTGAETGADLYALYRWQGLVAEELSARKTMARGEYYQAMKEYQELVEKRPSPESLFDLAGIYSRLGLLGKEALVYEEMEEISPEYPELPEAIRRNDLKRKPKVMMDGGYSSAGGRDGYLDIYQTRGGGRAWMMPSLRQEVDASWSVIHATSQLTDQALWRNRFLAAYSFSPHSHLDFISRLGLEKPGANAPDEGGPRVYYDLNPLYHLEMRGRIGDELQGFARLRQDMVEDTVQALEQGISMRDVEGGLSLDILPRLICGGEYRFREYSDTNHQNRYFVWASHILHSEPTLLQVSYGQELQHNSDNNQGRNFLFENGFFPNDHPYWSPREYWQNQLSVHFQRQLAADVLGRSSPSYYSLDYSLGYEEGGYDNHRFGGEFFFEMGRHFLVSSSFEMVQGGQEIRKSVGLSLNYRF